MSDNDALVSEFCALTAAEPEQARHYLEASKWDINMAVNQFFGDDNAHDNEELDDEDMGDYPSPAPPSAPAGGSSSGSGTKATGASSDLKREDVSESDSDGEERQKDFFAGGEKSGLAIQEPGKGGKDIIQNILNKAKGEAERRQGQAEASAGPSRPRFTGSGHTLGSDESPSVLVPDTSVPPARTPETVHRSLTFWRDGFSIEDGPLMRYDEPANQEILRAIQSGRAPTALMGVQQGQQADVHVFKRLDEDYVPPKKKFQPFSGSGNRLGSPTPEVAAAPIPVAAPAAAPQASAAPAVSQVNVDSSQPATSLQIRLGDGTRLVSRFNHSHTVGDIYSFVNSASATSRSRGYVLQTTFPNKELTDKAQTVKDAGLVNAVVVQKWR
ncbi:SEP-domain-containing protein [Terfezia boudieri ATCC MYA-4762]|uniref:SEP-domain-containing protein n=1 Tax=Terfezia boudieri ATCC MYA-4762 TaxID=1051890 RepID=A0A3N4LVR4_9PEZI|nr:SEP-domain-containing protein [Terfezia boudieri ATCC MYA-4762]